MLILVKGKLILIFESVKVAKIEATLRWCSKKSASKKEYQLGVIFNPFPSTVLRCSYSIGDHKESSGLISIT